MKHFRIILLFLVTFFAFIDSHAFLDREFRVFTMENGLSDNKVNTIYKDKDGFMWFGTSNGLSRYDGTLFKNFSISSKTYTNIEAIDAFSSSCLAIKSGNLLYAFDKMIEAFIPVVINNDNFECLQFIKCADDKCWIVEKKEISLYIIHENEDIKKNEKFISLELKDILPFFYGENQNIVYAYFSAQENLFYIIDNTWNITTYSVSNKKIIDTVQLPFIPIAEIKAIFEYQEIIWITTFAYGIITYNKQTKQIRHLNYYGENQKNTLSHTDVYGLIPINNNKLLAVTYNGYTILQSKDGTFNDLHTTIYNNVALIHQNVEIRMICAYYDERGIIWIGTYGGGIICSDLRQHFFYQYHQDRHNEICGITIDDDGYLWLATFHKGIMKSTLPFNPMDSLFFEPIEYNHIKGKTTLCLTKENETIWFGNQDGTITSYKRGKFQHHTLYVDGIANSSAVWAIFIDRKKHYWIGTENSLLLYDPISGICEKIHYDDSLYLGGLNIRSITESKDGKIWIGTVNQGLFQVRNKLIYSIEGERINTLKHIAIRSLLTSTDGNLYIGSENGFGIVNPQTETLEDFFTTKEGLCNNFIGCIAEDDKGQIWLGSNSGISRYSRHQKLFYHYYISGSNRSVHLYNGFLFWGNNKSLTYFNPESINAVNFLDRPVITELEIGNIKVNVGEKINGQVVLKNSLFYTNSIKLNSQNRDISLTFSNLSYSNQQQKFQYRLYPYQQNWMVADKSEMVSYANLPKGKYIFELKNLYPDERESKTTSLNITLLPHWTETWGFKLILITLALLMIGWLVNRIRMRQKRLEHELQLKHEVFTANIERDKEKQIRLERENFFTNVSHELRTPLTLINAPLQEVINTLQPSDELHGKLSIMQRNISSLHTLIDQLLYLQKIEAGMVKLRLSKADLIKLVNDIAKSFLPMAESRNYHYQILLPEKPLFLWIDVEKISSAIQNLLSNAFKYTPSGGTIRCCVERTEIDAQMYANITVSDTGTGISEELQEHIFDSFITGENTPSVSTKVGVGLRIVKNTMDLHHGIVQLKSKINEGSTFILLIHEGKEHFKDDNYEIIGTVNLEEEPSTTPTLKIEKPEKKEKTLLVIEDNEEMRSYIKSLFLKNYDVLEACNGEEGTQMASENIPNVIISDVMMPVKDGFACCKEIKENPQTAHIPILMLTAKSEDTDILLSSKIGVDDYMMKPFNPEVLKSKIENLIQQRQRLRRIYTKALMLKQEKENSDEKQVDDFMQNVINIVEVNMSNEAFNVKTLAEQMNMSQPTLYRKLKQKTDIAAVDIIRSIRMSKAASLLMENKYSMQQIADMVGYNDIRTLRKHFSDLFGVSPSKYMEHPTSLKKPKPMIR